MTRPTDDDPATTAFAAVTHPGNALGGRAAAQRVEAEVGILTGEITSRGRRIGCTSAEYALLAFLALHDGFASGETIAAALWPDRSAQAAQNLLWATVQHIRRRLTNAAIATSPEGGYALGAAIRCDVRTAEKLLAIAAAAPSSIDAMALKLHGYFNALRSEGYRRLAWLPTFAPIEARMRALGIALERALIAHELRHRNVAGAAHILELLVASAPDDAETVAYAADARRALGIAPGIAELPTTAVR
jgi:DNA-binding winged helix-turn-helix (wHTH) protein